MLTFVRYMCNDNGNPLLSTSPFCGVPIFRSKKAPPVPHKGEALSGSLKHPPLEGCATAEPPCRFCVKNFGGEERKETMYV